MRLLVRSFTPVAMLMFPLAAPCMAQPAPVRAFVTVSGHVIDEAGTPVLGAEVMVNENGLSVRSDSIGVFRFDAVGTGAVTFTARRLGFMPHIVTVNLVPEVNRVIDFELTILAVPLSSVEVSALAGPRITPRMERFNERKAHHSGGTFITRADVERLEARTMSDLMRVAPGLRSNRDRRGRQQFTTRGNTTSCRMKFFLDGIEVELNGLSVDDVVKVQDVDAIEFYHGVSSAPAEFSGTNFRGDAACGVLVVWTRER